MSNSKNQANQDPFMSIDATQLANVSGGAARVTSKSGAANSELTTMLTSIGNSIKDLAASKGSSGQDPMQMMMMMMMMGGMGGGGGSAAPAPAAPPAAPQVNVCVKRGC